VASGGGSMSRASARLMYVVRAHVDFPE
jgi:hypothetical protein